MAVHKLEGIPMSIADRHQFQHAVSGVGGDARCLIESIPAAQIGFDAPRQVAQEALNPRRAHEIDHVVDADERDGLALHAFPTSGHLRPRAV